MEKTKRTKIFMDTEFTGLYQDAELISLGMVAEDGNEFYAELSGYDTNKADDDWLIENVISKLTLHNKMQKNTYSLFRDQKNSDVPFYVEVYGDKYFVKMAVEHFILGCDSWHKGYCDDGVEIWADCLAYDWVLFCNLWQGAMNIPKNIFYIPFDISTLFKVRGIDPDISREEYAGTDGSGKHNALDDAWATKLCYDRLMKEITK